MDQTFNVNNHVRVRLTETGLTIYRKSQENNRAAVPPSLHDSFPLDPRLQDDGSFRLPMWELCRLFGPHLTAGLDEPFETNIVIEVPDASI